MLRVFEAFSGVGAQCMALRNLKGKYKIVATCTKYTELQKKSSAESFTQHELFNNVVHSFFPNKNILN